MSAARRGPCPGQVFSYSNMTKNPIPVLAIPGTFYGIPWIPPPPRNMTVFWAGIFYSAEISSCSWSNKILHLTFFLFQLLNFLKGQCLLCLTLGPTDWNYDYFYLKFLLRDWMTNGEQALEKFLAALAVLGAAWQSRSHFNLKLSFFWEQPSCFRSQ